MTASDTRVERRAAPKPARIPLGDRATYASREGRRAAGFTLVEVLVALLMMALLAGLAWQAMDGVARARDDSRQIIDRTTRLATVLAQWEQDLQGVIDTEAVPAIAFDGQTLRLTRRSERGVALVAWSVRGGRWQRWTQPPFVRSGELQEAWLQSQQLQGTEPGHLTLMEGASQWQVYFARDGLWSNAQSTGNLQLSGQPVLPNQPPPSAPAGSAPSGAASAPLPTQTLRDALPDAVRMVITLDGKTLTRDIALGPAGS